MRVGIKRFDAQRASVFAAFGSCVLITSATKEKPAARFDRAQDNNFSCWLSALMPVCSGVSETAICVHCLNPFTAEIGKQRRSEAPLMGI